MSFLGTWSANVAPSPTPTGSWGSGGSGGTWSTNVAPQPGTYTSWGSGSVESAASAPASAPSGTNSGGGWLTYYGPAPIIPGFASQGPLGEGGPYTELDYPEMRFLRAGENPTELLTELRQKQRTGAGKVTSVGWAALALMAFALVKGR